MKIVFASNYFNHHEKYFCDALVSIPDVEFLFIETEVMEEERINLGWMMDKDKYCISSYTSKEAYNKAIDIANNADVLLFGSAPYDFIKYRIRNNKLTFFIAERLFRNGIWHMLYPPTFFTVLKRFIIPGRLSNFYMLCASGYTAYDVHRIHTFKEKCYKWGHFVTTISPAISRTEGIIKLLWVGRLIELKHPEFAIQVAHKLKILSYNFKLDIIGTGILKDEIQQNIKKYELSDYVRIYDSMSSTEVRKYMSSSDIFLFTSDFNEGWGAVLGEAMSSGCAVVCSHGIGAVPFLVEHNKNGLIYKTGSYKDFEKKVINLMDSEDLRIKLGNNAIKTMQNFWNPQIAAERLYYVCKNLLENKNIELYDCGPMSSSQIIKNNWFNND